MRALGVGWLPRLGSFLTLAGRAGLPTVIGGSRLEAKDGFPKL